MTHGKEYARKVKSDSSFNEVDIGSNLYNYYAKLKEGQVEAYFWVSNKNRMWKVRKSEVLEKLRGKLTQKG